MLFKSMANILQPLRVFFPIEDAADLTVILYSILKASDLILALAAKNAAAAAVSAESTISLKKLLSSICIVLDSKLIETNNAAANPSLLFLLKSAGLPLESIRKSYSYILSDI
jgi:hypothetical protein